ncbi:PREDICTED: poly [ADP-ribose] polymerase 4-like [Nanorana parkeri]|uniref:poly [ADP-ribose] polymerase 4-like n=1 Tax=Nanorana parkeri TaxID=125878 RepID=UPI00085509BC|nr:PREDICTED: poly [ADP-ribose] polymerase 4-like [Nanorana parkeri]
MGVGIFSDCVFFLKVTSLPFKEKKNLKTCITSNGGVISFVVNEKCTHVVVLSNAALNSSQQKNIQKHCIPIVKPDFIWRSAQENRLVEVGLSDSREVEVNLEQVKDDKKSRFLAKFMKHTKSDIAERDLIDDEEFEEQGDEKDFPYDADLAKYSLFQKGEEIAIVELLCFCEQCPFPFKVSTVCGIPGISQLEDIWRILNPSVRDYTFYSFPHCSHSRIDYFLVSHHLLSWDPHTAIDSQVWSDHYPVSLDLSLEQKRSHLRSLLDLSALKYRESLRRSLYEHNDKCGRLLARSIRTLLTRTYVPKIQTKNGQVVHSTDQIAQEFQAYYAELYNIPAPGASFLILDLLEQAASYIAATPLPTLPAEAAALLGESFSLEEVTEAIGGLPSEKSPGPDGFTGAFYKHFRDPIAPLLLSAFNSISADCPFTRQSQEAHITIIPKTDKDLTLCSNYSPISLINVDLKLYAKLLANRLSHYVPSLINLDQVGFVPFREARDNTVKTLTLMCYAKSSGLPMCLLSVDAEKAFDRLNWNFLTLTLEQIGLPKLFVDEVMALYHCPTARVRVNGSLSFPFSIRNGTGQGCPLSPFLYVLAMEHLAKAIWHNPSIQGVCIQNQHYKLGLYADDVLLYLSNPRVALPFLLEEFWRFGLVSNFKVNLHKTEALNVSLPSTEVTHLKEHFHFKWQPSALKYLGVLLSSDHADLYRLNFAPLLQSTISRLQTWTSLRHSWMGRIALFKIDILPRFLYLFQTLPLTLPSSFFRQLRTALLRFIWNGKRPRLAYNILVRPKDARGLALPDLKTYYYATLLTHALDRKHHEAHKLWVSLETYISPVLPFSVPCLTPAHRPRSSTLPFTLLPLLRGWDLLARTHGLSPPGGPMTPIMDNPEFQPGCISSSFLCWSSNAPSPLTKALTGMDLKPLVTLLADRPHMPGSWLLYFQLCAFYATMRDRATLEHPFTCTSVKYTEAFKFSGERVLLVCDVALGKTKDVDKRDYSITEPPQGFHSLHGVRSDVWKNSQFIDDEYVVYDVNQVKMRYVVQFCTSKDTPNLRSEPAVTLLEENEQMTSFELTEDDPLEALPETPNVPKGGLQGMDGQQIPLESIHVKARIMDLAAQVVIFQTYKNNSFFPIEAKYVFPLDSTAAVCGFEAFINGKHIVGEVKEKQQAHQEYRTAISQGHGAYLMDQDAPDVFTVSVGNLPVRATVIIKITYVAELKCSNTTVEFSIPGTVASWQEDQALKENTQDTVAKVGIEGDKATQGNFHLDVSVEMPRKIEDMWSYTHSIKKKQTECKAVIKVEEGSSLIDEGFCLNIRLEDAYIPRMWVETHPDQNSEACMLIFQPQFEESYEMSKVTIFLDCSNSMESCFHSAKQVALLALKTLYVSGINIVTFGSTYKEFYLYPKQTNDLSEMETFIKMAKPNMGSTEFWKPLQSTCLLRPSSGHHKILLISDGHLQNDNLVFQILKKNKNHIKLFTCGVGAKANKHMLRCLAKNGAGAFEYFADKSKSSWRSQMDKHDSRLKSAACTAVSIKWSLFGRNPAEPMQAPTNIQTLFDDDRIIVYGFVPHCTKATLKALINNKEFKNMVSTTELQKTTGTILHKLTARAFIQDYEEGILNEKEHENEMEKQKMKSFIIKLSKEHSIVTQFTSFIAVEKRVSQEKSENVEPNSLEIISAEDVDILSYMEYADEENREIGELTDAGLLPSFPPTPVGGAPEPGKYDVGGGQFFGTWKRSGRS